MKYLTLAAILLALGLGVANAQTGAESNQPNTVKVPNIRELR